MIRRQGKNPNLQQLLRKVRQENGISLPTEKKGKEKGTPMSVKIVYSAHEKKCAKKVLDRVLKDISATSIEISSPPIRLVRKY